MNLKVLIISIIGIFMVQQTVITGGFGAIWKKPDPSALLCSSHNNKLLSLLNLLCNTTQTTSIQTRDACYGCFFRSGSLPGGATQLSSLSDCANLYLAGTAYASCAVELALVANGTRPTTPPTASSCYTGYCDFVRCVRRINANNLIDACFMENLVNRDLTMMDQRVFLYTNITSCILARTRCNSYNPITGELQSQVVYQYGKGFAGFGTSLLGSAHTANSLQISSSGDLRIISFPSTINVADLFCSRVASLEQSSFGNNVC